MKKRLNNTDRNEGYSSEILGTSRRMRKRNVKVRPLYVIPDLSQLLTSTLGGEGLRVRGLLTSIFYFLPAFSFSTTQKEFLRLIFLEAIKRMTGTIFQGLQIYLYIPYRRMIYRKFF